MSELKEVIEEHTVIGDREDFAISYAFIGADRITEIGMFVGGINLLGFTRDGRHYTTRWAYLESLVAWLNEFALSMREDPYPMDVNGEYAAQKDVNARTFESDDVDELDAYYDPISDWSYNHTWISERGGAILANIYFEYKDGCVELSWNNRNERDGVKFDCEFGGVRVDAETFKAVVLGFVDAYEKHWGIKVDDDTTWLRKR